MFVLLCHFLPSFRHLTFICISLKTRQTTRTRMCTHSRPIDSLVYWVAKPHFPLRFSTSSECSPDWRLRHVGIIAITTIREGTLKAYILSSGAGNFTWQRGGMVGDAKSVGETHRVSRQRYFSCEKGIYHVRDKLSMPMSNDSHCIYYAACQCVT